MKRWHGLASILLSCTLLAGCDPTAKGKATVSSSDAAQSATRTDPVALPANTLHVTPLAADPWPAQTIRIDAATATPLKTVLELISTATALPLLDESVLASQSPVTLTAAEGMAGSLIEQACQQAEAYCAIENGTLVLRDDGFYQLALPSSLRAVVAGDDGQPLDEYLQNVIASNTSATVVYDPIAQALTFRNTARGAAAISRRMQPLRDSLQILNFTVTFSDQHNRSASGAHIRRTVRLLNGAVATIPVDMQEAGFPPFTVRLSGYQEGDAITAQWQITPKDSDTQGDPLSEQQTLHLAQGSQTNLQNLGIDGLRGSLRASIRQYSIGETQTGVAQAETSNKPAPPHNQRQQAEIPFMPQSLAQQQEALQQEVSLADTAAPITRQRTSKPRTLNDLMGGNKKRGVVVFRDGTAKAAPSGIADLANSETSGSEASLLATIAENGTTPDTTPSAPEQHPENGKVIPIQRAALSPATADTGDDDRPLPLDAIEAELQAAIPETPQATPRAIPDTGSNPTDTEAQEHGTIRFINADTAPAATSNRLLGTTENMAETSHGGISLASRIQALAGDSMLVYPVPPAAQPKRKVSAATTLEAAKPEASAPPKRQNTAKAPAPAAMRLPSAYLE